MAGKLLAVKVGGLKKICCLAPALVELLESGLTSIGSNYSQSLMDSFATLQPFDLQTLCYLHGKIQTLSQCMLKVRDPF